MIRILMFADDANDGCERRGIAVKWGDNRMGCTDQYGPKVERVEEVER